MQLEDAPVDVVSHCVHEEVFLIFFLDYHYAALGLQTEVVPDFQDYWVVRDCPQLRVLDYRVVLQANSEPSFDIPFNLTDLNELGSIVFLLSHDIEDEDG